MAPPGGPWAPPMGGPQGPPGGPNKKNSIFSSPYLGPGPPPGGERFVFDKLKGCGGESLRRLFRLDFCIFEFFIKSFLKKLPKSIEINCKRYRPYKGGSGTSRNCSKQFSAAQTMTCDRPGTWGNLAVPSPSPSPPRVETPRGAILLGTPEITKKQK